MIRSEVKRRVAWAATLSLVMLCGVALMCLASFSAGYNAAKHDVAAHWWDYCRQEWRGMITDADAIRSCGMAMPNHIGMENKWGFR